MPATKTGKDAEVTSTDVEAKLLEFFTRNHDDGGKSVAPQDLLTMRQETIATGKHSRTRLVEVKKLNSFLQRELPGADDLLCTNREPTIQDPPEVGLGIFALKVMKKSEVARLKEVDHVKAEADILSRLNHPFLISLYHRFQDERNLCLLTEFVQLGSLATHINRNHQLPNNTARFYAAQIVMAVQFLHAEHIIFRNLSPHSVWLDRQNYIKLVDFSFAKGINLDDPSVRSWTVVGEPEYMSPEMVCSKGHSKEVDWWALGVMIHEMLAGYPPFFGMTSFDIYKMIQKNEEIAMPKHFDEQGKDLLKKLLVRDRTKRIGSSKNGAEDIKKHKWYRGLNWAALYNKQISPLPLHFTNGDPLGSYKEGVPTGDGVPCLTCARTPTGGPDVSNFSKERSSTTTDYPNSSEEQGPLLDQEKDEALFGSWGK